MATITLSAQHPFTPTPFISSPLASANHHVSTATQRTASKRIVSFPSSRPLRPFPTISHAFPQSLLVSGSAISSRKKPVKLIQPPKNHEGTFVLNLTQAEFSRQD